METSIDLRSRTCSNHVSADYRFLWDRINGSGDAVAMLFDKNGLLSLLRMTVSFEALDSSQNNGRANKYLLRFQLPRANGVIVYRQSWNSCSGQLPGKYLAYDI